MVMTISLFLLSAFLVLHNGDDDGIFIFIECFNSLHIMVMTMISLFLLSATSSRHRSK